MKKTQLGGFLLTTTITIVIIGLAVCFPQAAAQPAGNGTTPAVVPPDTASPRLIRLASREFTPPAGVDPRLEMAAWVAQGNGATSIHCLAQLAAMPVSELCQSWVAAGIHHSAYLGESNWVVRVPVGADARAGLEDAARVMGAVALTVLVPEDKAPAALRELLDNPAGGGEPVKVRALFFPTADPAAVGGLIGAFGNPGLEPPEQISPVCWVVRVVPGDPLARPAVEQMLAFDGLHFASEEEEMAPLMDLTRRRTGAEGLQQLVPPLAPLPIYAGYTGRGVKLSNREGLNADHDDFWNHDAAGNRTTQRWVAGSENGNGAHGWMTAGIMLGNGWGSAANGGSPHQFRGMAPEAGFTFSDSGEDAANFSFAQWDAGRYLGHAYGEDQAVRGEGFASQFHPRVWAVGNNGIDMIHHNQVGYYSVYSPYKNAIVVAKVDKNDLRWAESSLGPTFDGRIKPDLSAPGQGTPWPAGKTQVPFKVDYVRLSGGTTLNWEFNGGPNWHGGWGQLVNNPVWFPNGPSAWFTALNVMSLGNVAGSFSAAMSPPPWFGWDESPMIGTFTDQSGITPLAVTGSPSDVIKIRYSIGPEPFWATPIAWLGFSKINAPSYPYVLAAGAYIPFPVIADGNWHEAVIPVGSHPAWINAVGPVGYIDIRFANMAGMETVGCCNSYQASGGSSAAAPVVTGALALLLEQMNTRLGCVLGSHAPSPFWSAPGTGVPLPSTLKAILLHTADDLASIPQANDPNNPDTGVPTVYHKGPDLATGYGNLNVGEAARLVEAEAQQSGQQYIREREFTSLTQHTYTFVVPPGQTDPLRITLVWDDLPGTPMAADPVPRLINDLDLEVVAPGGSIHYPWTIDLPYQPLNGPPSQYPDVIEPEPITAASIKPARRDLPDHRNNVEQVHVEAPAAGLWTVKVRATSLPMCGPQKYSLVVGMPPTPAQNLTCGKVVFVSDRPSGSGAQQLYVKQVGAAGPPSKITSSSFFPHHPAWSPDGRYIAYIDRTVIVGGGNNQVDALFIVTETGVLSFFLPAPGLGVTDLGYPEWSPDGKKIVITTHNNNWGARDLKVIEFNTAYNFNGGHVVTTLVPSGPGAGDATFSPDGKFLYYNADSGGLGTVWRVPATGGAPSPVYANAAQIARGYAVSISPDGRRLIYNSELWKDDPIAYLDEELLQADLLTGVSIALTHEPGNQYGKFAKGGSGEYVMQSSASVSGKTDIFLATHNARVKLDIADPNNLHNDGDVCWWKPARADYVHVAWDTPVCLDDTYTDVRMTICNQSCAPHPYSYSAAGLPGVGGTPGATCNVDGPTQFQFLDANPVVVPAMGCVTVKVRMFRPPGLTADKLVACFHVTVNNLDTGASFGASGSLQDARVLCANPPPCCIDTERRIGTSTPLVFPVVNATDVSMTFNYRLVPVNADMVSPVRFLSLNGLPPGEPVTGVLADLAPGATTNITAEALFLDLETGILDVLLQVDAGSPGEFRTLMSQAMRSLPGSSSTVILEPPQLAGDTLTLRWSGVGTGQPVVVEASTDLADWTAVAAPPVDARQLELPLNPEQPARFFRLRAP